MFDIGETVIVNNKASKGIPNRIGERAIIIDKINGPNYDFKIEFDDGQTSKVKKTELYKVTDDIKWKMDYIFTGSKVILKGAGIVKVIKVDYLSDKAEVEHTNGFQGIVDFNQILGDGNSIEKIVEKEIDEEGYFEKLGLSIGKLVDQKQKAYGDSVSKCYEIMKVLLKDYHDEENHTYTIPESLLPQMLLDIRKIDKMNRRFTNPDGDLMGENPFQDDVGYSMLGVRLIESFNKN